MRASPTLLTALGLLAGCGFNPAGSGGGGDDGGGSGDGGDDDAAVDIDARDGDAPPPDARGPGRRKQFTIDPLRVEGNQTEFPVYVAVTDPAIGARAQTNGSDLYFTAPNGTVLPHEIQAYNDATGRLEAWVKLPLVDDLQPTSFYLIYGDTTALPVPNPGAVWSNGFNAVWHLDVNAPASEPDSAGDHDATSSGGQNMNDVVAAKLGRGLNFDGANDQLAFTNTIVGAGAHTFSAWVNQRATSNNDALLVIGNSVCNQSRWLHSRFDADTVGNGFYCSDWPDTGQNLEGDGWVLVHWVYDGITTGTLYVDGVQAGAVFGYPTPALTAGTGGFIGNAPAGFGANMGINATLDEVRIATVARSAGWISTERANQNAPASFYVIGPEE